MHNIQNETEWHSWSSCLPARITGVEHHTWFIQDWGSNPGHTAWQPLNQMSCRPSPNVCISHCITLASLNLLCRHGGWPGTHEDLIVSASFYTHCLPVWYKSLCFCHSIPCSSFSSDCYNLYIVYREYYDLYVLLCGNQLQTHLNNYHYTEIHFQNVTIFQRGLENTESAKRGETEKFYLKTWPRQFNKTIDFDQKWILPSIIQ